MVIAHVIPEAAVNSKATMAGSDGGLRDGVGHPRSAGTSCRVLGHYSRDLGLLSVSEAVRKMTVMPAKRFEKRCPEFKRKGRIKVGSDADLAFFDPKTVIDKATFDKPAVASVGMQWVLIEGREAVREGSLVEEKLGKPLRAKRSA